MAIGLLVLYSFILIWAACTRSHHSSDAFFVNKRQTGAWGVGLSIIVSCVGASATIGTIGMAFTIGTPAFWWLGAGCVGLSALTFCLAKKVRATGAYTLPHLAESLLGKHTRPLTACIIILSSLAVLAAQFSAIVPVLEGLLNLHPLACLGLGFLFIVLHSLGGQAAIMRMDRIQACVLFASLCTMLIWLSHQNPTWLAATQPVLINAAFPPEKLVYFLLIIGANYFIGPMLFSKILSAKNEQSARNGGLIAVIGLFICALLIVSIGLACKGLIPANTPQDAVLTTILSDVMPPWMHLVVAIALLSAIVSSADSTLVAAGTVLIFDLLGQSKPSVGRVCIFILGIGGAMLSLWGKGILNFLLMAYDVFSCGVVMPVFVGLMAYGHRRIDSRFACMGIVVGGICGISAAISGDTLYNYIGFAFSGVLTLLRSAKPQQVR